MHRIAVHFTYQLLTGIVISSSLFCPTKKQSLSIHHLFNEIYVNIFVHMETTFHICFRLTVKIGMECSIADS